MYPSCIRYQSYSHIIIVCIVVYLVYVNRILTTWTYDLCGDNYFLNVYIIYVRTMLFTVCSSVTIECCVLYPCCVGVFCTRVAWVCFVPVLRGCVLYVCSYERKNTLLQCLCNYWEDGYGHVWGALANVFVGFRDGDYVSQLPYVWYYVGVKSRFQQAREECESKRTYVF